MLKIYLYLNDFSHHVRKAQKTEKLYPTSDDGYVCILVFIPNFVNIYTLLLLVRRNSYFGTLSSTTSLVRLAFGPLKLINYYLKKTCVLKKFLFYNKRNSMESQGNITTRG